jgi:hypothetical protein
MTYEESGKTKAIEEELEFLSYTIHRLGLTTDFPPNIAITQLANVQCAALNLCTAIMQYLTLGIQHFSKPLACKLAAR